MDHLGADPDLDGGLADHRVALALLHQGDEVDQLEAGLVAAGAVDHHLEGGLGALEGVAPVLQALDLVGEPASQDLVALQVDAELLGF